MPFGLDGDAVEVEKTYVGFKAGRTLQKGAGHKRVVLALVDRDSGQLRWFHIDNRQAKGIHPIVLSNIAREARLMTDEAKMYCKIGRELAEDGTTVHAAFNYLNLEDCTIHPSPLRVLPASSSADARRVPALRRALSAPVPCRIRVPL